MDKILKRNGEQSEQLTTGILQNEDSSTRQVQYQCSDIIPVWSVDMEIMTKWLAEKNFDMKYKNYHYQHIHTDNEAKTQYLKYENTYSYLIFELLRLLA